MVRPGRRSTGTIRARLDYSFKVLEQVAIKPPSAMAPVQAGTPLSRALGERQLK